jgi:hypothetical protein
VRRVVRFHMYLNGHFGHCTGWFRKLRCRSYARRCMVFVRMFVPICEPERTASKSWQ